MTTSVTKGRTVTTTHTAFVAAPPRVVYDLIADASRWPYIFTPTVHVERLHGSATEELLRLWVVANGAVRNWISRRTFDAADLRIRFRQETPSPPVASMGGEWVLIPLSDNATSVVLLHEFRAIGDHPGNTELIKQAVDRSSTAELAMLKSTAELDRRLSTLVHSLADSVTVRAEPGPVYDFLYRAQDWPQRLPHVSSVVLDETVPNLQTIELDTVGADGSTRTTGLVRVCFPYHSIVYKQTRPPDVLSAHLGEWHLYPTADGVRVTSRHTVMLDPERATRLLGRYATVEQARSLVRRTLASSCLATLMHAKSAAEGDRDLRVVRS
jgi:aromatase